MDARRTPRMAWLILILLSSGCTWNYEQQNARRNDPPPAEPQEPPQVVERPPPESQRDDEPNMNETVIEFIERVDDARKRAQQRHVAEPDISFDPLPQFAADEEEPPPQEPRPTEPPPTSQPVAQPAPTQPTPAAAPIEPPRLGEVTPRALAEPRVRESAVSHSLTGINEPLAAASTPLSLREYLEHAPEFGDDSFRAQLDRRMLWVVAGEYVRAREPLELVTAEQQELARRFVDAWIAIRDWHLGDPAAGASAAARELAELHVALRRLSDLSMPSVKICRAVRGFGQYDEIEPARFPAGRPNEWVLYCEVSDFVSRVEPDGQFATEFDMTTTVLDATGTPVVEFQDPGIVDRCRNQRHDCFIPRLVQLPPSLSSGEYVAKVTVIDKLGQKVAQGRATFELVGRP